MTITEDAGTMDHINHMWYAHKIKLAMKSSKTVVVAKYKEKGQPIGFTEMYGTYMSIGTTAQTGSREDFATEILYEVFIQYIKNQNKID